MDTQSLWDALGVFTFACVLGLVGLYLRKEYRRFYVGANRMVDPVGPGAPFAAYLGYIASFFLAASLLMFASSAYMFGQAIWWPLFGR